MEGRKTHYIDALPSAVRTTSVNSADIQNRDCSGLLAVVDVTAFSGTAPTLTVTIKGKDRLSGKYFTLLANAVLTGIGTTVLRVYPGLVAAANLTVNDVVPSDWRVETVIGGTTPSFSYSIGLTLIP